ncbi:hypothetical protein PR202_gb17032 [Eleusine coracana subsp. coracana]|uniref:DNA-binding protein n=1 Tax=Eleusine coracana subsp. coracana TaxID=191504 RepID=A0AAV5F3G5_ELECO|nr:hypothetical protein PR202_gb17032 [Eleusine coracana subsp. coracana]
MVDVTSRKRGHVGRKPIPIDLEPLHNISLNETMTLEEVSKCLKIRKARLITYLNQGRLRRHSNNIKPFLTKSNKKSRLQCVLICLIQIVCLMILTSKIYLIMCSLMKNGFSLHKNLPSTTCCLTKMIHIILEKVRTTFHASCFWEFQLDRGLRMECVCVFHEKIGCFPLVTYERAKRNSVN